MLTVLIATRNGAKTLPGVLRAYCRLEKPSGGWKLVIVDNGSTDETKRIIGSFRNRLPLTYMFEARDGKNMALNTGLAFVSGDLVVLSDDDAFPRPDWLVQLRKAADSHRDISIFGGLVLPKWETLPPDWILKCVPRGPAFAISSPTLTEGPVDPNRIYGPNMAIRTEVFRAGHRFDGSIGPRASGRYAMGSETELVCRLAAQGMRAWHVHEAVVEHFIRSKQLDKAWLIKRAVRAGRGNLRLAHKDKTFRPSEGLGIPLYMLGHVFRRLASMFQAVVLLNLEKLFRECWELGFWCGQIAEARIIRTEENIAARSSLSGDPQRNRGSMPLH